MQTTHWGIPSHKCGLSNLHRFIPKLGTQAHTFELGYQRSRWYNSWCRWKWYLQHTGLLGRTERNCPIWDPNKTHSILSNYRMLRSSSYCYQRTSPMVYMNKHIIGLSSAQMSGGSRNNGPHSILMSSQRTQYRIGVGISSSNSP